MNLGKRSPLPLLAALAASTLFPACSSDTAGLNQPVPSGSVECKSNAECPAAMPACDLAASQCVQCLFDTQCADGAECRARTCVVPTKCTSSLNCVAAANSPICDPLSGKCVACAAATDCTGTAECVSNECVPYEGCKTSLNCTKGKVCDSATEHCVECVTQADCPEGNACAANQCVVRTACVSDKDCTPLGKLCDKTLGYCVECLTSDQCADGYHCTASTCALNACQPGTSKCQGNSLVGCDAAGQSWLPAQPCAASTTCKATASVASCVPWTCEAGMTYCQGDTLLTCAADGMSVTASVDCATSGKHCGQGICRDLVCTPNTIFCEGKAVRQCNIAGTDSTLVQTCGANQVCDTTSTSCIDQICTPGTPSCSGTIATTCNATGTGYTAGGTDCASQGKACDNGACSTCPAGGIGPANVRMTEVYLGTDDYIVLSNLGSCKAQLDTLQLRIASNYSPPTNDLTFDLPPFALEPGAKVYVIDPGSAQAGDISVGQGVNIYLTSTSAEYVMLCDGSCSAGIAIDYFAHGAGGTPPVPPGSSTFTPGPLTGITQTNEATDAYKRTGYAGANPTFTASDWTVAAATRPTIITTGCPATQPVNGSACTPVMSTCPYGAVNCFCWGTWSCQ